MFDGAGNKATYTNAQLQAAHFSTTLTISSNPQDTTPPNLLTLTFPASVDLSSGEKFMDWFATAHDASGIGSLTVWFDHDIGFDFGGSIALYPGFIMDGTTGDPWTDGGSSGRLTLPTSDAFDLVLIDHVDLYDKLGNLHTYTSSDLSGLGIQTGFVLFNNQIHVLPADVIPGTPFNDNVHGGPNNNFIWTGPGDDTLSCGGGSDYLDGGPGNDTYFIISPSDVIIDTVSDGGFDSAFVSVSYVLQVNVSIEYLATIDATSTVAISLSGNSFDQTIEGNAGDNLIFAGDGYDIVRGGLGNDTLVGDTSLFVTFADTLDGGAGNDIIYGEIARHRHRVARASTRWSRSTPIPGPSIRRHLDRGQRGATSGDDTVNASTQTVGVTIYGSGGNDTCTGSNFGDFLWGGVGNDTLIGNDGNDVLFGDTGIDSFSGGAGNDSLYCDSSDTTIDGGAGFDALYWTSTTSANINLFTDSVEFVQCFASDDTLNAASNSSGVIIFSGGGTDTADRRLRRRLPLGRGRQRHADRQRRQRHPGRRPWDRPADRRPRHRQHLRQQRRWRRWRARHLCARRGLGAGLRLRLRRRHVDKFDVSALHTTFASLSVTSTGPHAQVTFGTNTFIVVNAAGQIDSGDFLF